MTGGGASGSEKFNNNGTTGGNTSSTNRGPNLNLNCKNCGKVGHTIERCFDLIGYPPGYVKPSSKTGFKSGFNANVSTDMSQNSSQLNNLNFFDVFDNHFPKTPNDEERASPNDEGRTSQTVSSPKTANNEQGSATSISDKSISEGINSNIQNDLNSVGNNDDVGDYDPISPEDLVDLLRCLLNLMIMLLIAIPQINGQRDLLAMVKGLKCKGSFTDYRLNQFQIQVK
ncbi:gag-polypeptide of LTR copia-type [Artemisia annua]|uniref:Gag-polypeptide of LTR copia-type n=1 Tax=Artemisia annua TaxID=35608 RepID=A0A2U1KY80_ARTAN|nr:gag-polypeptide of LTR copia-type [Artemisia annua]